MTELAGYASSNIKSLFCIQYRHSLSHSISFCFILLDIHWRNANDHLSARARARRVCVCVCDQHKGCHWMSSLSTVTYVQTYSREITPLIGLPERITWRSGNCVHEHTGLLGSHVQRDVTCQRLTLSVARRKRDKLADSKLEVEALILTLFFVLFCFLSSHICALASLEWHRVRRVADLIFLVKRFAILHHRTP